MLQEYLGPFEPHFWLGADKPVCMARKPHRQKGQVKTCKSPFLQTGARWRGTCCVWGLAAQKTHIIWARQSDGRLMHSRGLCHNNGETRPRIANISKGFAVFHANVRAAF